MVCFLDQISDADIRDIVEVLGYAELQTLYDTLGLRHQDIEKVEYSTGLQNVNLCARNVLRFWRQTIGRLATRHAVLQALGENRNRNAKEQLEAKWTMKGELAS